jgi:hypothetical protein
LKTTHICCVCCIATFSGESKLEKSRNFVKLENWCRQNTGYQGDCWRICLTAISNFSSNWILWHMNNTKLSDNFVPGTKTSFFGTYCFTLWLNMTAFC